MAFKRLPTDIRDTVLSFYRDSGITLHTTPQPVPGILNLPPCRATPSSRHACFTNQLTSLRQKKTDTSERKFCFHSTSCEHLISSLATLSFSYRLTPISTIIIDYNYIEGTRYACKSEGTELQSRSEIKR